MCFFKSARFHTFEKNIAGYKTVALKGIRNSYATLFAVNTVTMLFVKDIVQLKQTISQEFPEFCISKADQLTANLLLY